MERIIHFDIEHLDEMGDLCQKTLIVELMGKHSNIIFCNSDGMIIDSIKHVSSMMSSVREVLPGRAYCIPATQEDKLNPLEVTEEVFMESVMKKPVSITKAIYGSFTGISPVIANEICYRASIDGDMPVDSLDADGKKHLFHNFSWMMEDVKITITAQISSHAAGNRSIFPVFVCPNMCTLLWIKKLCRTRIMLTRMLIP